MTTPSLLGEVSGGMTDRRGEWTAYRGKLLRRPSGRVGSIKMGTTYPVADKTTNKVMMIIILITIILALDTNK